MHHFKKQSSLLLFISVITLSGLLAFTPAFAASTRYFSATIAPTSTNVGTSTTFTIVITNGGSHDLLPQSQSANMQSAQITVPSGFSTPTSVSVTTSNSKHWSVAIAGNKITLNSGGTPNQIPAGGWVKAVFKSVASITGTFVWTVQAWNGNPAGTGVQFAITGSQPSVAVTKTTTVITNLEVNPKTVNPTKGQTVFISGNLIGRSIPSETITLSYSLDGKTYAKITTATSAPITGYFSYSWKVPASLAHGNYVIQAQFNGDNNYLGSCERTMGCQDLIVMPEYAFGALAALGACFFGLVIFKKKHALLGIKRFFR